MSSSALLVSSIEMVHRAYGGAFAFWVAVLEDEVAAPVLMAYRQAAEELALLGETHWLQDLYDLEASGARRDYAMTLEVAPCLVDAHHQGPMSSSMAEKSTRPVVERVRAGVLDLLDKAQVLLPSGQEPNIGTQLVEELTGPDALDQFDGLLRWLTEVRRRHALLISTDAWLPAGLAVIERFAPNLFVPNGRGGYRDGLSFRLFLRSNLFRICEKRAWTCRHSRGLRDAFHSLDRDLIGDVFEQALKDWASLKTDPWRERAINHLIMDPVAGSRT